MKRIIITFALLHIFFIVNVFAVSVDSLKTEADSLYAKENYEGACKQ